MREGRNKITLPERVLTLMDHYASEHGETRSGFFAQAAMDDRQTSG
jgi:hypothetical protein